MGRSFMLWALLALLAGGCAHAPHPSSVGPIVKINIITSPVGLNLDNRPGADAFSVKVYANDSAHSKTVPIAAGKLEILMFDGTFFGKTNVPPPRMIWTFGRENLGAHQVASSIGTGYDFLLPWGAQRPTERLITVVARYTRPDGAIIVSPPSSVTVLEH